MTGSKRPPSYASLTRFERQMIDREIAHEEGRKRAEAERTKAKAEKEERRKLSRHRKDMARAARENPRQIAEEELRRQERRLAWLCQRLEWQRKAIDEWKDVVAFREANPPEPVFRPGEEPFGWRPHMDRGARPGSFGPAVADEVGWSVPPEVWRAVAGSLLDGLPEAGEDEHVGDDGAFR